MGNALVIFGANYVILIVGALLALAISRLSDREMKARVFIQFVLGVLLLQLLIWVAGQLYYDPRPFVTDHFTPLIPHANDNGFPSDHTAVVMLCAFTIWPFARKWGIGLAVIGVVVGACRVLAGVHRPQDIIGGIAVAALAAAVPYYLIKWTRKRAGKKD
jgi:undecaprenyl-diphosphatase